jgi:Tfp pilus assembly protein PilN
MTFHGKTPINNKRLSFMGQGFNSNLILEVKKFINDCIDRKKEDGGVFLTGDPDLSYRFQKLLCGDLGVESEYLNLSSVFGLRPTGDDSFSTAAIGLAVRGIMRKIKKTDFLQDFQKEESVKRIPLLKTGVLGLTILLLSFGLLHLNLITKEKKLNDIRERLLKIQPQIGDHIERREGLEKRVNELRHLLNIERDRARWTRILQEIDLVLPKDTWITHLVLKKDELKELRGCTLGSSARLARILQSSKYFENVKFSGPILKDNFERQRIERFKLRADIIKERG